MVWKQVVHAKLAVLIFYFFDTFESQEKGGELQATHLKINGNKKAVMELRTVMYTVISPNPTIASVYARFDLDTNVTFY